MNSQAKKVAQYARKVKEIGVELQELLRQENNDKDARTRTLKMLNLILDDESTLDIVTKKVDETNASLLLLNKQSKIAIARENKIIAAIEKKKNDVDRNHKLLESLNIGVGVKPKDNRLQEDLQVEYESYVVKIRNVDYLENELRSHHSLLLRQRERVERKARRIRDAYEESLKMLEGEGGETESVNRDDDSVANTLSDDTTEPSRSDESLSAPSHDDTSGSVYDSDGSSDSNF
eukprot:scaffold26622_cov147-Skeletonema_menzelii.AAC.4